MSVVARHISQIRPSETEAMTARAAGLERQGRDIITLSQGEPDFDTPVNIREAGMNAIREGRTRYTAVPGVLALRDAIRHKLRRDHNLDYGVDQISVSCGAKQTVFNALFASLDPGDEVIIPAPCWASYPDMVRLAGGKPILIQCSEEDDYKLRPDLLADVITSKTKWLILNSPCNPTGAVYARAELRGLAEVLRWCPRVLVLTDDIYEKLVFGSAQFATMAEAATDMFERTLTVNGVSKINAMTGWRVGYGAGPADLIKAMNTIQGQTTSSTCSISQHAAIEAIQGDQSYIAGFVAEYEQRRNLLVERLNQAPGLSCRTPDGAFYVFPSCAGTIGKKTPSGTTIKNDVDLAMYLLEDAGVGVVPGSAFMASPYIRISYASSQENLQRACNRIVDACTALSGQKAA